MNKRARPAAPLVFDLLGTAHAVEARLEAALDKVGLSLAKTGLLALLADAQEPVPLSELAQHRGCVRSNITQLVDRLEKEGLVRRRADPDDRRGVRAALTAAGEQAHTRGQRVLAEEQRGILSALTARDAESLKGVLELLGR